MSRGVALGAAGLLSLLGAWGHAQDGESTAQAGQEAQLPAAVGDVAGRDTPPRRLPAQPDRARVPSLAALEAALRDLQGQRPSVDTEGAAVGGPALEHAALALAAARVAEGEARAEQASLSSRRIAYAALSLAVSQRGREQARLARDAAARERARAEADLRWATRALDVARENAAESGAEPAESAEPTETDVP